MAQNPWLYIILFVFILPLVYRIFNIVLIVYPTPIISSLTEVEDKIADLTQEITTATKAHWFSDNIDNSLDKCFVPYASFIISGSIKILAPLQYYQKDSAVIFTATTLTSITYTYSVIVSTSGTSVKQMASGNAPADITASVTDIQMHFR